jgi:hypothetical protein
MVAGCSAVDISAKVDDKFVSGSTVPGLVEISLGSLFCLFYDLFAHFYTRRSGA